jgi:threonine dehydrogenase-like Zn-dependent dehydrogenase
VIWWWQRHPEGATGLQVVSGTRRGEPRSRFGSGAIDLRPLVTHRFKLDQIEEAYDLFSHQRDGVLKVAITP